MSRFPLCIALAAVAASSAAYPQTEAFKSGNALLRECVSSNEVFRASCTAYIVGVVDSVESFRANNGNTPCAPRTVEAGQLRDVVVKFLQENPTQRDAPAAVIVTVAYAKAWGC
jgi:hypothetical protein